MVMVPFMFESPFLSQKQQQVSAVDQTATNYATSSNQIYSRAASGQDFARKES
jgi:hypothetical protein